MIAAVKSRGNVPVTSLLPFSSKFTLQYILCDKARNPVEHFFFVINTILSFLGRGCWREIAGGKGILPFVPVAWCGYKDICSWVALATPLECTVLW